jgi:hypothetical protein
MEGLRADYLRRTASTAVSKSVHAPESVVSGMPTPKQAGEPCNVGPMCDTQCLAQSESGGQEGALGKESHRSTMSLNMLATTT